MNSGSARSQYYSHFVNFPDSVNFHPIHSTFDYFPTIFDQIYHEATFNLCRP